MSRSRPTGAPEESLPISAERMRWLRRIFPWVSLATGICGAFLMNRGPAQSALVASAAVLTWITLLTVRWLSRLDQEDAGPRRRFLISALAFSSLTVTQSLLHLTIWFSLPFYWRAATFDEPGHVLFMASLVALSVVSLWDPLSGWLLRRRLVAAILPTAGSFLALTAVLPGFGLSTHVALLVSLGISLLSALLFAFLGAPRDQHAAVMGRALAAVAIVLLAFALGAARIVPAAPLRLMKAEIGTRLSGKWIADPSRELKRAPERLICATSIWSPIGVRDQLYHVWRKDGVERARIKLKVLGGRTRGYRTHSRIAPGKREQGLYRCSVETESGQVLGSVSVRVSG